MNMDNNSTVKLATDNYTNNNDQSNDTYDNDDADCFPWQDKQHVLPQDLSCTIPNTTE